MLRRERLWVAAISLLLTWAFFFEYIPPTKQVHLWSDIEGYHYPLLTYANKSLREGRIPLWDPSIYCGIPFAGNIQAGLFYPPNWLLFVANARMPKHLRNPDNMPTGPTSPHGMRFTSIEIFAFLHAWLAFYFGYLWLRERMRSWLPAVLGGAVIGFSGYVVSQMNHLGVLCGYAWMPFALWGVEQANRQRSWRPLWKLAVGSAMCLLAGYPPTWVALLIVVTAYAAALSWRRRLLPMTMAAVVVSVLLGAVQLLPAFEAAQMKTPEFSFGGELYGAEGIFRSLLVPNYFNQNRITDGPDMSEGDYLYLGAPALFGILWLLRRRWFSGAGPALAIAGVILFVMVDPLELVEKGIVYLPVVPDVLRRYNLLAGLPLAGGLLAASAADDLLARQSRVINARWTWVWMVVAIAWAGWLFFLWPPGGPDFTLGMASAMYPALSVPLLIVGLFLGGQKSNDMMRGRFGTCVRFVTALLPLGNRQTAGCEPAASYKPAPLVTVLLVMLVFAELKVFGTNRRFNAAVGNVDRLWRTDARVGGPMLAGLDRPSYHEMLRYPGYRIALHVGPHATDMRHYGLATPQGFDPFLPDQYRAAVEAFVPFRTNRLFDIDPMREDVLRYFAVRWVMVRHESEMEAALLKHTRFRQVPPADWFYAVFEYLPAEPAWRFEGDVTMTDWMAERRAFRVNSASGGTMILKEQFFPGWHATVDGREAAISRAEGTFQSVSVPPGDHSVEFRYAPASLYIGAGISLVTMLVGAAFFVRRPEQGLRRGSGNPPY